MKNRYISVGMSRGRDPCPRRRGHATGDDPGRRIEWGCLRNSKSPCLIPGRRDSNGPVRPPCRTPAVRRNPIPGVGAVTADPIHRLPIGHDGLVNAPTAPNSHPRSRRAIPRILGSDREEPRMLRRVFACERISFGPKIPFESPCAIRLLTGSQVCNFFDVAFR